MSTGLAEVAMGDDDWENSAEGLQESRDIADGVLAAEEFANHDRVRKVGGVGLALTEIGQVIEARFGPWSHQQKIQYMGRVITQMPSLHVDSINADGSVQYSLS